MSIDKDTELLPCPFCGSTDISEGKVLTEYPSGLHTTQSMCRKCACLGAEAKLLEGEIDYGSIKATAAWNTRFQALQANGEQEADGIVISYGKDNEDNCIAKVFLGRLSIAEMSAKVSIGDKLYLQPSDEVARLKQALQGLLERYTSLVNCGDCGNWDCETEIEVIAAREALGTLTNGGK